MSTYSQELARNYFARKPELRAVVRFSATEGFGVLVGVYNQEEENKCVVLTTPGCLNLDQDQEFDRCFQMVETHSGSLKLVPHEIVQVGGIAVLGPPDAQEFSEECDAWDKFCENTTPIPLAGSVPSLETFRVKVFRRNAAWELVDGEYKIVSHGPEQDWMNGTARNFRDDLPLWIQADQEINAYGGPVLDAQGELLGIIGDHCAISNGEAQVIQPLPVLPVYIVEKYFS